MSEENTAPVGEITEETTEVTTETPKTDEISIPKARFDQVNQERKAYKAKLDEIERKTAEEQGNYKELATKYEQQLNELSTKVRDANLKVAVTKEASSHNPHDVEAVMKFIDIESVVDKTGEVKQDVLSAEFNRVKQSMPYLFKDPSKQTTGNPSGGNPENTNTPIFRESQLQDSNFVSANIKAIEQAKKEGKILLGQ